jgi:hypothetical protein
MHAMPIRNFPNPLVYVRRLHNVLVEVIKNLRCSPRTFHHVLSFSAQAQSKAPRAEVRCVGQIVPAQSAKPPRLKSLDQRFGILRVDSPLPLPHCSHALLPIPIHVSVALHAHSECRERSHRGIPIQLHVVGFPSQNHLDRPQSRQNRATAHPEHLRQKQNPGHQQHAQEPSKREPRPFRPMHKGLSARALRTCVSPVLGAATDALKRRFLFENSTLRPTRMPP